jgi:hypothetical protein
MQKVCCKENPKKFGKTYVCVSKLVLIYANFNYARCSGMRPHVNCDHTVSYLLICSRSTKLGYISFFFLNTSLLKNWFCGIKYHSIIFIVLAPWKESWLGDLFWLDLFRFSVEVLQNVILKFASNRFSHIYHSSFIYLFLVAKYHTLHLICLHPPQDVYVAPVPF